MPNDLAEFIVEQLTARGIRVQGLESGGPSLQAWCYTGHDQRTPSLSIRKSDGAFFCFGCGVKGPDWNVLAEKIGGHKLRAQDLPDQFTALAAKYDRGPEDDLKPKVHIPWDIEPWDEPKYRGLPAGFLHKIQACKWYDNSIRAYRILLPIHQQYELMGWVARRLDKEKFMRYRNMDDIPAKKILYPYDFVNRYFHCHTVVIVEGPFDALRLCRHHIPALAILGTNNWADMKKMLLKCLDTKRVIICTDADPAGKKCRFETLEPALQDYFDVEHYYPPAEKDPGNMSMHCVKELRAQLEAGLPKRLIRPDVVHACDKTK